MDERHALSALSALSQESRLRIVRILVQAGPGGVAAGLLAAEIGTSTSNISFHLKELEQAGLIRSRREGRSILYTAAFPALSGLIAFLMRDCCLSHPEICAPAIDALSAPCTTEETTMSDRIYNVLFLCTGNSARSVMAEAMLNKDGKGRFRAYSAGTRPKEAIHPLALQVLRETDYATEGLRAKSWDAFAGPDAPEMDLIFTLCDEAAGESCPVWPGHPVSAHWGIENPAAVEGSEIERKTAFVSAQRYIRNRIAALAALPIASLDQAALNAQVHEIGRQEGSTAPRAEVA